jgi:hypothetical protein
VADHTTNRRTWGREGRDFSLKAAAQQADEKDCHCADIAYASLRVEFTLSLLRLLAEFTLV